jgi:hypothetical protein
MKRLIAAIALLSVLILSGCGASPQPAPTPTPAPEPTPTPTEEPFSPVWTDWSKLESYEAATPVYTLHAGYCGEGPFRARDDYGVLLPYVGKYASIDIMYSVLPTIPLYGIVTARGEVVTDPVYARLNMFDDFIVLYRGDPDGLAEPDVFGAYSRTIIAPDGSWAIELEDEFYVDARYGRLTTASPDGTLIVRNAEGEIAARFDGSLFTEAFGEEITWGSDDGGPHIRWAEDGLGRASKTNPGSGAQTMLYLDLGDGSVSDTMPEGVTEEHYANATQSEDWPDPPSVPGFRFNSCIKDGVTGEYYFCGYYREKPQDEAVPVVYDAEGRLLGSGDYPFIRAGLVSSTENDCWCYRRIDGGELVFRYPIRTNSD